MLLGRDGDMPLLLRLFIDGRYVGVADEVVALHEQSRLWSVLRRAARRVRGGLRGVRRHLVRRVRRWTARCAAARIQGDAGERKKEKTTGNIWYYGIFFWDPFQCSLHGTTKQV